MEGIKLQRDDAKVTLFTVDYLSNEFKEAIRNDLAEISYGKGVVQEDPVDMYSYKETLKEFFKRYDKKTIDIKKGMIGELISNVLIRHHIDRLNCISVFFNKEERSIKKGYDIVYFDVYDNHIWYSEVKSGTNDEQKNVDEACKILLKRADADICTKFQEKRRSLWDSAIIDARNVFYGNKKKQDIFNLLKKDWKDNDNGKISYNAILISVLFYSIKEPLCYSKIVSFYKSIAMKVEYENVLIFAIHKNTFTAVEQFLKDENNG